MAKRWLNLFFKTSGFIHREKQKLAQADSFVKVFPRALFIIVFELGFVIISLPLYFLVSPEKVQETGVIFPTHEKDKEEKVLNIYRARRKIGLTTGLGAGGFFVLKILLILFTSFYLLGGQALLAATQTWTFDTAGNYTYDSGKIEVTGGVAQLKSSGSCSGTVTTCDTFSIEGNCTGQTGCSWNATYPSDSPTINPTTSLSPGTISSWDSFTETATTNGGSVYYQLSDDDGSNWNYWTGSAWATSTLATHYNTSSTINSNILTFPTTNNKLMWKAFLVSNGTQLISIDSIDVGYTLNDLPDILNLEGTQTTSTVGIVYVNYDLQDGESDFSTLATYKYSLTGAFGGEEETMTASTTHPNHDGISNLISSSGGTPHTFVWDTLTDLGNTYDGTVYVQLQANDGVGDGVFATSSAFAVDILSPVLTNVLAVQNTGSTTVQISYDLNDDTYDNLFVELGISEDSGSTWVVTSTSVIGDVGLDITTGTSKIITWDAGVDFDEQNQNDLQVHIRARDYYLNQGGYVTSTDFLLDTVNPITNVTSDLLAQPLAGSTTTLIGGSFIETNPNTNDFYVVINDNVYLTTTTGDTNTASPGNLETSVGATLDGNDYISKVKITHTDDYGQTVNNENLNPAISYKYVKPYTPQTPTLSNPITNQLDLTIVKHVSEAVGLEYAIYETETGNFVQSNGTLGVSAVWQIRGISAGQWGNSTASPGKVNVNGLTSPVSQYIFQTKSRNTNDASHAISSQSSYSATAQITNTAPSITLDSYSQTTDGTRHVVVNYTGTDGQGDINNITQYEYSQNNSDWSIMTEKLSVGSSGISNLVFLSGGSTLNFVWDSGVDLSGVEDSSVYVRLKSNDATVDSNLAASSAFVVDNVNPVVSSVSASQNVGARTVDITYNLADANSSTVEISISDDGGSNWNVTTSSAIGDIGSGVSTGSKTITWDAGVDFNNEYQTDLQVRVRALDIYGNQGDYSVSSNFVIDTNDPVVTGVTALQDAGVKTFTFNYTVSEDLGNVTVGLEISGNGGSTWAVPITSALGDIGSGITPGSKTITWDAGTDYNGYEITNGQIRITATDSYSNVGLDTSSNFTIDTLAPRITSLSAVQDGSVTIAYDLADVNWSTIEIGVSDDSGSTWDITTTSISGDVGSSIVQGAGKIIIWNAAIDFDNQEETGMRVRAKGIDTYSNQSGYAESSDFSLDTVDPLANITSDLQSQPNAGDITVLIGGSFTETNPDTNDFYIAINGGAYSSGTAGDINTSSPSNQATAVGATLDGNDYISKTKIIHTDDFGQIGDNENTSPSTSLKYVKPYIPSAPTVNNPTVGTVDVLINLHAFETAGLEYIIYEISQGKYVQSNGALGDSAVWQTLGIGSGEWGDSTGVIGKVNVNGLVNDSYTYQFQIKSRNTSDSGHAVSSESALSTGASSANQAPEISFGSVTQTTDGTKYVTINYTGSDLESETCSLVTYKYSTDNAIWYTMTEKSGIGSDGIVGLAFSSGGTSHDFMWDVGTDLNNTEDVTVYVRLKANDGTTDGNDTDSSAFTIDTKNPVVVSPLGLQVLGTNSINFTYTLTDLSNSTVEIDISEDGGSNWGVTSTSVTGDIGSGVVPGSKTITWDAGTDFNNQDQNDLKVRIRALDNFGNQGIYAQSTNFLIDTQNPVIANVTASQNAGLSTVNITYDISDTNNSTVEIDISEDGGINWGVLDTSVTGDIDSGVASGTNKVIVWDAGADFSGQSQDDIKVRVRAYDIYANNSGNVNSANFTLDTLAPVVSNVSASQTLSSDSVVIIYNLSDISLVDVEIDISDDGGITWSVASTSITGDVGLGITPGVGKTITWDAGVDFNNKDQNNIKVRVRGLDSFANSSGDIESSNFNVDTLSPAINITADLQSQPNAGDATVLIGGSFTETNPDTNDFHVSLNGGSYVTSTVGDINTASPANQVV